MGEKELKVGMMTKRAQQKKSIGPTNYKDRVFVLTPTKLSYYEGNLQQRGKVKGSLNINHITFVGNINDSNLQGSNTFQIAYNDCYLYCCPKTSRERDEWILAITQACINQGNLLQQKHHTKIFSSGKWQCCLKSDKNAPGCEIYNPNQLHQPTQPPIPGLSPISPAINNFGLRRNTLDAMPHSNPPYPPSKPWSVSSHDDYPPPVAARPIPKSNHSWNKPLPAEPLSHTLPQPVQKPFCLIPPGKQGGHSQWPRTSPVSSGSQDHTPNVSTSMKTYPSQGKYPPGEGDTFDNEPEVRSYGAGAMYPKSHALSSQIVPVKNFEPSYHQQDNFPPPPQPAPDTSDLKIVTAIYDFEPQEQGDIPLRVGESYTVLDTGRPHWWKVRNSNWEEGYVPANYCKEQTGDGLETQDWFQKDLSRQRAEYLLKQDGKEGSFIIRNSSQPSVIYTLSVVSKCGMINGQPILKHYHIRKNSQDQFFLSEKHAHATIMALINYHKYNAGGLVTRLRQAPQAFLRTERPSTHLFSDSKWEIDVSELSFDRELGSGQFGVVRLGKYRGKKDVALKIMKEGTMEEDHFIEEAEFMTKLHHPNLVELYGVVTKQRPICIVTEYMEGGCLLEYIRKNHYLQTHPDTLLDMCYQVCGAMKYLESINTIHRDLAARNCLVGKNLTIKVADFGLSRYVLDDEYTSSLGSKFPIKWAAPEVLNYTKFSSKSDVWAFGVLMWELFTGGKTPYRAFSNTEVVERVAQGHRLERPQNCPHAVYSLMLNTWDMEPEKRPSFESLHTTFNDLIDTVNASCLAEGMYDAGN
uniref:Tyrosine-protein kinase n=1 Tax=Phallusia mammillata TaxID=59560 RepID=A0A6F9D8M1_9ASCI|nr:tyrosine-protein kinase Btk29A [Phallusia mammillata]